jgi:hypothetical protein
MKAALSRSIAKPYGHAVKKPPQNHRFGAQFLPIGALCCNKYIAGNLDRLSYLLKK